MTAPEVLWACLVVGHQYRLVFTEGMVEVDQASGWLALEMCGRDAMGAECWIPIQRFRFSDCIRPTGLSEAYEVGIALLMTALCAREERSA